jgi:glycosyltransferase involved in cell wall biosynthesis
MSQVPRLSIGLPVYNGEQYLAESIEALLGQTFEDFELVISDNASTDETEEICRKYGRQDRRIRYFRQPRNIGLAPNHGFTLDQARGELFKWASHDDLYGRDLHKLSIEALDKHPEVVLAHSWTARIDETGAVVKVEKYPLATASPHAPERFRSTLFVAGGDDDGGIARTEVLRRVPPPGSYYRADRTAISELTLYGPFYQVPEWLFFRRDHPDRAEWKFTEVRDWCANLDPRRANRLRYPVPRLYAEYFQAYYNGIRRAPLSRADRRACYRHLAEYTLNRIRPGHAPSELPEDVDEKIDVNSLVAGREYLVAGREDKA